MSSNTQDWFKKTDLKFNKESILLSDLHGYVLPHASTTYTGHIISHTLRCKPKKLFNKVVILYFPAYGNENVIVSPREKYYHEYYVPWQSLLYAFDQWGINKNSIIFTGINVREDSHQNIFQDYKTTLFVVSADFSHYKPLQEAIETENIAAHALMYKNTSKNFMDSAVDDPRSFQILFKHVPKYFNLRWIGRTRGPGTKAVGYLSFLLVEEHKPQTNMAGIFVTCYDVKMRARECLGDWFSINSPYSKKRETDLVKKVTTLGQTTSRLTGGQNTRPKIKYYTISYLYKSEFHEFIRGWHTILGNATYLSDVFLENTFNNGTWIQPSDTQWPPGNEFNMRETTQHLNEKAHTAKPSAIGLYDTYTSTYTFRKCSAKLRDKNASSGCRLDGAKNKTKRVK